MPALHWLVHLNYSNEQKLVTCTVLDKTVDDKDKKTPFEKFCIHASSAVGSQVTGEKMEVESMVERC